MFCSISGHVAQNPVVCKTTGFIYERGLIEKMLQSNGGECPHTGIEMGVDDLINVRTSLPTSHANGNDTDVQSKEQDTQQKGMTISALTNVPLILQHLQNEWESKVIENAHLRKSLQGSRQELAASLYRLDAAQRIIAKLQGSESSNKGGSGDTNVAHSQSPEEDPQSQVETEQRKGVQHDNQILAEQRDHLGSANQGPIAPHEADSVIGKKVPDDWLGKARVLSTQLMTTRKARVLSEDWAQVDEVGMMSVSGQCKIGAGEQSGHAVTCIAIGDKGEAFFGLENGDLGSLKIDDMALLQTQHGAHYGSGGHVGVNSMWLDAMEPNRIYSGGADGILRAWDIEKEWEVVKKTDIGCEIVGLERHPEGSLFLVGGSEYWTWQDVEYEKAFARSVRNDVRYECSSIHPDGLMFAMGCANGIVEMWDVGGSECVSRMGEKGGKVNGIAMSEKGYYMASCRNGIVELWDLRKREVVGKVDLGVDGGAQGVALDSMGEYACAVGNGIASLFVGRKRAKTLARVGLGNGESELSETTRLGVAWGAKAKMALVGGAEGMVYKISATHNSNPE